MFKDITVTFDQAGYDVDANQSLIQGWAIDPITKSPVEIECSIPATINTIPRQDVNDSFGIDRETEYGFFIQFPGSLHELKPTLTFKTKEVTKEYGGFAFENQKRMQPIVKAYKVLVDQGILPKIKNPIETLKNRGKKGKRVDRGQPVDPFQEWMDLYEESEWTPIEEINREISPKLSIIIPYAQNKDRLENTKTLKHTLDTVRDQLFDNYEVFIAADTEFEEKIKLDKGEQFVKRDNIAEAVNEAVNKAQGDYITFVGIGDLIPNHFVSEISHFINENPEADFIYGDSDKLDFEGNRYEILFKPNYDEILLQNNNYILQPIILKKDLFQKVGGLRNGLTGLQNYDLVLRATKEASEIKHLQKVLYHWLIMNKKASRDKSYMKEYESGIKMLEDRFTDENNIFTLSDVDYSFDYKNKRDKEPKIAIITGVTEGFNSKKAQETVANILNSVDYPNLEVILTNAEETLKDDRLKYVKDLNSETKAQLYNNAAKLTDADVLVFLEPGFKAVEMSWIYELLDYLLIDSVGIVGPKFYNRIYQIEEAGVRINNDLERENIGQGAYLRSNGYNLSLKAPKEVFAVSDNCLMISHDLFNQLNGFDESLASDETDIDLSIRARKLGKKSVVQNNVSATLESFNNRNGAKMNGLIKRYEKEELEDFIMNDNFKPINTASKYKPIGI